MNMISDRNGRQKILFTITIMTQFQLHPGVEQSLPTPQLLGNRPASFHRAHRRAKPICGAIVSHSGQSDSREPGR